MERDVRSHVDSVPTLRTPKTSYGSKLATMRQIVAGLAIGMAVMVAGCSSGPSSAVVTAQQTVDRWQTAVQADTRNLEAMCAAHPASSCGGPLPPTYPLVVKTKADKAHLATAQEELRRAES